MDLMQQFADPGAMNELSLGEKILGSGITAIMGMGVTFVVLLFLWGCIALMAKLMPHDNEKFLPENAVPDIEPAHEESVQAAVITAAIAAYESYRPGLVVRKIKRISGKPAWSYVVAERKGPK